mmetsp:Transcript_88609/g.253720  ORF Transcript_88609/g.253720 Transcript_88609/m.253720 type:complete len:272 (+) Transcript_88609:571-1386(+)
MVDQAILRGLLLRLQRPEECLLRTKDLHRAGGMLGEAHEGTGLRDEPSSHQLADHVRQVRCDGVHAKLEVLGERGAVLGELDHALGERVDVDEVLVRDVGAHGGLRGLLNLQGDVLRHTDLSELGVLGLDLEAHVLHHLRISKVLRHDLAHFGEVPTIPLPEAHREVVEFFVKVVQQTHSLHDHDVDLVWRELELEARKSVRQTQGHGLNLGLLEPLDECGEVQPDAAHHLFQALAEHRDLDAQLFVDVASERLVEDGEAVTEACIHDALL